MNTIERAMGKLLGDDAAEETTIAAEPAAPGPGPGATPAVAEITPPTAGVPSPPPAAALRATEPSLAPPTAEAVGTYHEPATAFVNFARLGELGYLVPGQDADEKSEEYQRIKRRLLGNMVPGMTQGTSPTNLIMVTSSVPGEGKTFTSMNLAVSLAMEIDRTVLLIDTDIIKADLTRLFGAIGRPGLFNLLSQQDLSISDVLLRTNIPKLVLLPCGTAGEVATEKLASEAMRRLTDELARRYSDRIIIFDSPPILAATGAGALSEHVGQIVMVVEAGKTTHEILKHALDALDHVTITGLVFNKSKQPKASGYSYHYYYHHANKTNRNGRRNEG